jgi:microcystin-dependent protein
MLFSPGDLKPTAVVATPAGWLPCDGTQYLNTAFPALAAAVGTTYGGDGTHFNVPDLRGRMPMGTGSGPTLTVRSMGQSSGAEVVALANGNMPIHNHGGATASAATNIGIAGAATGMGGALGPILFHGNAGQGTFSFGDGGNGGGYLSDPTHAHGISDPTHGHTIVNDGGGTAHNNLPPFAVLNWLVKT